MLTAARARALTAYGMVATACLFGLVVLRAERLATTNLNDSAVHTQMVRYIDRKISAGSWPLAGWYPFFGLGYPFLQHYQATPAFLTAIFGTVVGDDVAHAWALYLLLALWPAVVYLSARLFELDWLTAGCAALVSPLLMSASSYGYEHQSYTWQGFGIWTQLFGMWALPLSWALTWRALSRGGSMMLAAVALTATVTLHFLTGYQALCAVGIWVLVGGRAGFLRRVGRAAVLYAVSIAASAWVLLPLVSDGDNAGHSATEAGLVDFDSYGARKILGWLFSGDLYDAGRGLPVVSLLVALGVVVCAIRWRSLPASHALLPIFTFSFLLWFGRPFWGRLTDVLPGSHSLLLHRMIMGCHLAGILLAGVGLAWLIRAVQRAFAWLLAPRAATARWSVAASVALSSLVVLLLVPAAKAIRAFDTLGADQIAYQRAEEAVSGAQVRALAAEAVSLGAGRVYAGSRNNWGADYRVGQVPVYAELAAADVDAPGFTFRAPSLSSDVEAHLDPGFPSQLRLLGVRWLIYPATQPPPEGAVLRRELGPHRLYELPGVSGLVAAGDIAGVIEADNYTIGAVSQPFEVSGRGDRGSYDAVSLLGAEPLPLTVPPGVEVAPPGTVTSEIDDGESGTYRAGVSFTRPGVAVLKASYHKHWKAYVDGHPARVGMVTPSFVAAQVPTGNHEVVFRFEPPDHHVSLLLLAVLSLAGLFVFQRRAHRGRPVLDVTRSAPQRVLVIVPALNEQDSVARVISELRDTLPGVQVLVVDDGSTDATGERARTAGADVLTLPYNLGVGGAMRAGFKYALRQGYDATVQVDGDGQHDASALPSLLAGLAEADIVVGARFAGTGDYSVRGPRRWAMRLLARALSRVVGATLTDATSGFRACNRRAMALFARHYPVEYLGDTVEALLIAGRSGLTVMQVPVAMRERVTGKRSSGGFKSTVYLGRAGLALCLGLIRHWPAEFPAPDPDEVAIT